MRGAAPKSCVCATSRLAPTHVPALSALPGVLERSKVAFGKPASGESRFKHIPGLGGTDGPHTSIRQLDPFVTRGSPAQPCHRSGATPAHQGASEVDPPALHADCGCDRRCGYGGECVSPASVRNRTGAAARGGGWRRHSRTERRLPAEEDWRGGHRVRSQASLGGPNFLSAGRCWRRTSHRLGRIVHQ
jgi:hypothetical protein